MQVFFYNRESTLFYGDTIAVCLVLSFDFLIFYVILNPAILFGLPHFTKYFNPEKPEKYSDPNS
jgi:hypothetical protein